MTGPMDPDEVTPVPNSLPGGDTTPDTAGAEEAPVGWLPRAAGALFGDGARAEETYGLLTVDVPAEAWIAALGTARDTLGCTYFDWLSAVDEPGTGFRVAAHVVALPHPDRSGTGPADAGTVRRLLLRTTVPHDAPALPTATGVYAGAAWHERETHEMFGVDFTGHPGLAPLLLPEGFEGHPLRKDFVLAARVAKAWPGAKEPGESEGGGPKRRQMLPPGVPDPNEWGPLKGQLPPAPARPARGARAAAGAGAAGDRPVRRARTAAAGSASQQPTAPTGPERPARRARSASEGSASQQPAEAAGTAPTGTDRPVRRARSASEGSASQQPPTDTAAPRRSPDAPWHNPRPAFEDDGTDRGTPAAPTAAEATPEPAPRATTGPTADADQQQQPPQADKPAEPAERSAQAEQPEAPAQSDEPAEVPRSAQAAETPAAKPAEAPAERGASQPAEAVQPQAPAESDEPAEAQRPAPAVQPQQPARTEQPAEAPRSARAEQPQQPTQAHEPAERPAERKREGGENP
ncbi:NADH-quinone oxidoreductase subunit C [Streptomyces sp. URMC 123]|uniref:NADH-quinone oxidoreductase subunit C n=1 Tax=Streptomyces sp. URMC 123 TaxID=3423403 RepID=UPI003F1AF697